MGRDEHHARHVAELCFFGYCSGCIQDFYKQSLPETAPIDTSSAKTYPLTKVFQIIFNEISAAEISGLSTMDQLELLNQFKVRHEDLENIQGKDGRFGTIERKGKKLYRYRSRDYRIYFEVSNNNVIVHRVLNRNTFQDFLFRSKLPVNEDEALGESKHFWSLIKEGEEAQRI